MTVSAHVFRMFVAGILSVFGKVIEQKKSKQFAEDLVTGNKRL